MLFKFIGKVAGRCDTEIHFLCEFVDKVKGLADVLVNHVTRTAIAHLERQVIKVHDKVVLELVLFPQFLVVLDKVNGGLACIVLENDCSGVR